MRHRPVDHRGFPVTWFVTEKNREGHWDFVNIKSERYVTAVKRDLCWVTGEPLGAHRSFVIGPMCVVNRVAADPPVRLDVGRWSAKVCPFLSQPLARRDRSLTAADYASQRGNMLERNPGVCAIYTVRRGSYSLHQGLFHLPPPESVEWWCRGKVATREEVWASVESGLTTLQDMASKEGGAAVTLLEKMVQSAMSLLPQGFEKV